VARCDETRASFSDGRVPIFRLTVDHGLLSHLHHRKRGLERVLLSSKPQAIRDFPLSIPGKDLAV